MTASRWKVLWVLAFMPFALLAIARWSEGPSADEEDYAQYLLHAKAIVEGRPYTDIGFIVTLHNRYIGPEAQPPGLPVLLAPVVAVGGVHSPLIKGLMLSCALGLLVIVARYYSVHEERILALGVVLLCLLQPPIIHWATLAMSDLPFMALVWATILVADRAGHWGWKRAALLAALGSGAIAFRVAGVALIPALAVFSLLRFREHRFWPVVPLVAWSVAYLMVSTQAPTTTFLPYVSIAPARHLPALMDKLRTYLLATCATQLYPFPWNRANDAYHVATLMLETSGLVIWLRRSWRSFLAAVVVFTVAMLLSVPVFEGRYLWPLAPVIVFTTLQGAAALLGLVRRSWSETRVNAITVASGAAVALLATVVHWQPVRSTGITTIAHVQQLYAHLQASAAHGPLRVMVFRPRVFTLETGIPAMGLLTPSPIPMAEELCGKRITHVVLGDLGQYPRETDGLRALIAGAPSSFARTHENASFTVFRYDGPCPPRLEPRPAGSQRGPGSTN